MTAGQPFEDHVVQYVTTNAVTDRARNRAEMCADRSTPDGPERPDLRDEHTFVRVGCSAARRFPPRRRSMHRYATAPRTTFDELFEQAGTAAFKLDGADVSSRAAAGAPGAVSLTARAHRSHDRPRRARRVPLGRVPPQAAVRNGNVHVLDARTSCGASGPDRSRRRSASSRRRRRRPRRTTPSRARHDERRGSRAQRYRIRSADGSSDSETEAEDATGEPHRHARRHSTAAALAAELALVDPRPGRRARAGRERHGRPAHASATRPAPGRSLLLGPPGPARRRPSRRFRPR